MVQPQVSQYELQRAQRIAENRRKMEEVGLVEASRKFTSAAAAPPVALEAGAERQPRKKRRVQPAAPADLEPTRLSRRLRGETALDQEAAEAEARAEVEAEGSARARRGLTRKRLALEEGQQLAAPFSLWSIGVTVWELGSVHRGAWAHRYWSSPGCLYHHAYPVGYRATKVQFGCTYEMRIEEGPAGPLFKVIDQDSGAVFAGSSPTKPWTDVCVAHRTGQRISGPLFFGFSDPLTQRAIAANLYSQEELRAALQGEKLESAAATPEEQAAQEFCGVEGVGEATAIVLARTTALGGSRHAGLESLRGWASASEENARALSAYLAGSEEVPESTRRWPAWRQRLVPKIVLAVSGRWLGSGAPPGAAEGAGKRSIEGGGVAFAVAQRAGSGPSEEPAAGGEQEAAAHGSGQLGGGSEEASAGTSRQAEAGRPAAGSHPAPGSSEAPAKENKQPPNLAKAPAIASAAAAAGLQRGIQRKRSCKSKWS